MTKTSFASLALTALLVLPAAGQNVVAPPPPATEAPEGADAMRQLAEGEVDPVEFMRQMGAKEEDILGLQLMSQVMGADMGQMMLLMMLADKGGMDDDIMGLMLLMKALGGGPKQPLALLDGSALLVIEDGTVYKINTDTMQIDGTVAYRQTKGAGVNMTALMPFITKAREKAQGTACLSNMKQLCMATLMYATDWDEVLPTDQWPDQVHPYLRNRAIFTCPAAPGKPLAYVMNGALMGVSMRDFKRPAETVLFFESDQADELPFGGPEAALTQPRHDGRVAVGFADGHAKLMTPEELQHLLAQDPLQ